VSRGTDLALALVESLDDRALERLAEALAPHLDVGAEPGPAAYTVATLARELDLSERAIRAAIQRGELAAVKRGRTYLITRQAVGAWAAPVAMLVEQPRRRVEPVAARSHRRVMESALAQIDGGR
jgi:excisionase family DNA binding protein